MSDMEEPKKVETAFSVNDRTWYTELLPAELPVAGDSVSLRWDRTPSVEYTVTKVWRSYDMDDDELYFVNVILE